MKYVVWCIKDRHGNYENKPYHYSWRPEDINEAYKAIESIFMISNKYELEVREWEK